MHATGEVIVLNILRKTIQSSVFVFHVFVIKNKFHVLKEGKPFKAEIVATDFLSRKYTVKITSTSSRGCSVTSAAFDVIQSGPAVKQPGTIGYEITNAFEDNQIITALVTGYGTYQYSLDDVDGAKQDSPVFENVQLGTHTIFVHDVKALSGTNTFNCEKLIIEDVQTIDYPHYFTPNGDGINDFWNISGLAFRIPTSTIYIFNRDGKLMKQISPDGNGWDGSFNNELAPSTDYWFTVDFTEKTIQKQFKSHFSLKR